MADPIILDGQNPTVAIQPGQKVTHLWPPKGKVTAYSSSSRRVTSVSAPGTYAPPVVPEPDTPEPPPTTSPNVGPLRVIPTPSQQAPALGKSVTDAVTGNKVTCIALGRRHAYPTQPVANADGTLLMLRTCVGIQIVDPAVLVDAKTFAVLNPKFPLWSGGFWSAVDPQKLYGIDTGTWELVTNRVGGTGRVALAKVPQGSVIGGGEGATSDSDDLIVVAGGGRLLTFDARNGKALGNIAWSGDNAKPSHSGGWVAAVGGPVRLYSRDLGYVRELVPSYGGPHGDWCLDEQGNDVWVMNNASGVRGFYPDGRVIQILPPGTAEEYGHVSGCWKVRGRFVLSNHNVPATKGRPGSDQVLIARTDESGIVEVMAMAHHGGESPYNAQPHAVGLPDGRVLFASEWSGSVGCYVVERAAEVTSAGVG